MNNSLTTAELSRRAVSILVWGLGHINTSPVTSNHKPHKNCVYELHPRDANHIKGCELVLSGLCINTTNEASENLALSYTYITALSSVTPSTTLLPSIGNQWSHESPTGHSNWNEVINSVDDAQAITKMQLAFPELRWFSRTHCSKKESNLPFFPLN